MLFGLVDLKKVFYIQKKHTSIAIGQKCHLDNFLKYGKYFIFVVPFNISFKKRSIKDGLL